MVKFKGLGFEPYTLKITMIGETLQPDADHAPTQMAAWCDGFFYAVLANGQHAEPEWPHAWLSKLWGYTQAPVIYFTRVLIFLPRLG